jgi:hypothetical protein
MGLLIGTTRDQIRGLPLLLRDDAVAQARPNRKLPAGVLIVIPGRMAGPSSRRNTE